MMKPDLVRTRVFVVFVFALTAGGAFAFATYRYVNNLALAPAASNTTTHVVVAAANLTLGDELGADDLRVVEWPANSVPAGRPSWSSSKAQALWLSPDSTTRLAAATWLARSSRARAAG